MKRIFTTLIITLYAITAAASNRLSQYMFTAINQDFGFSFNGVTTLELDRNGMLWFGCDSGLYYYNTEEFIHYAFLADDINTPQSNNISDILCDSKGRLWVCSSRGLSRFESEKRNFVRVESQLYGTIAPTTILEYRDDQFIVSSGGMLYSFAGDNFAEFERIDPCHASDIRSLYMGSDGAIYIGYIDGTIMCSRGERGESLSFELFSNKLSGVVTSFCEVDGVLYVGTREEGLYLFSGEGEIIRHYGEGELLDCFVRDIKQRHCGDIWVGTKQGVFVIYPNGESDTIISTPNNNLYNSSIYCLTIDAEDNVLLGLWGGYVALYRDDNRKFMRATQRASQGVSLTSCFLPRDEESVWVVREQGGVCSYNYKEDRFGESVDKGLIIKSVAQDSKGNIWLGTTRRGVYYYDVESGDVSKIELARKMERRAVISGLALDESRNLLWVGTRLDGVWSYNIKTREYKRYRINTRKSDGVDVSRVWDMMVRESGDLVICSDDGLFILECGEDRFKHYIYRDGVGLNSLYTICRLDGDRVLVGTRTHGVKIFDLQRREFSDFGWEDTIGRLSIFDIQRDGRGRVWLSSNSGVYMCDEASSTALSFGVDDGLICANFYPSLGLIVDDGTLFFGSNRGFNYINTDQITTSSRSTTPHIIAVSVNHESISDENCLEMDSKHIENIHHIKLSHNNNSLSFSVASGGVCDLRDGVVRYRLVGYQDKWVEMAKGGDITFTKLPFGRYTLEVVSCGDSGEWGCVTKLDIEILPPLYMRWYAWLFYLLLVVTLVVIVTREIAFRVRAKRDVAIERHKSALDRQASAQRTKFFINVSHELRTPLSLIVTPLNILETENRDAQLNIFIEAIKRNTNRLLRLTNQILDLRLMEVGKISPAVERVDVVELCREAHTLFEYRIGELNIDFKFIAPAEALYLSADPDMVDKVVCNLLSNALKFSNEGGSLTLEIAQREVAECGEGYDHSVGEQISGRCVEIRVKDSGVGIASDKICHIFDRFFYNNDTSISGSGIGLHMCKEYISLHGGAIRVRSRLGEGSLFSVLIPVDNVCEVAEPAIVVQPYSSEDVTLPDLDIALPSVEGESVDGEGVEGRRSKPLVLIADDNAEIRLFLKRVLSAQFNCIVANNGEQAADVAINAKPDLILMDILMPVMTGIECVRKIREREDMQLIPIILLTGVTDEQTVVECMESGADCHLSKPINLNLLSAHINRLLNKQSSLSVILQSANPITINAQVTTSAGEELMQMIEAIVEKNINNASLDTEFIAKQLNMSRSTLHRRIKSEFNIGVNEVIRDYRLRVAVKLMDNVNYNVDELAICVGFNSTSYFCKAFKSKYGTSPKRYRDQTKWR